GTELLNVRIVGVGAGGADDEEVAVAAAGAHPLEGGVDVGAAAHEHGAGSGGGGDVILVADAEIGILFGGESGNCAEYKDCGEKAVHRASWGGGHDSAGGCARAIRGV